jgi:hypothetical protein
VVQQQGERDHHRRQQPLGVAQVDHGAPGAPEVAAREPVMRACPPEGGTCGVGRPLDGVLTRSLFLSGSIRKRSLGDERNAPTTRR